MSRSRVPASSTRAWRVRASRVAVLATLALVTACSGGGGPEPSATSATSATPSSSPMTDTPSATAGPTSEPIEVTAYFLAETPLGPRLVSEVLVAEGDPLEAAVAAMLAGPGDDDTRSEWNPATRVLGVSREGDEIVVDLSDEARAASVSPDEAALMVQQLVYTVTGAANDPEAAVRLLIDGGPPGTLWGAVEWDSAVTRADPREVRALVQILSPLEAEQVTSLEVTVSGEAAGSTVLWVVRTAAGAEVASGTAMVEDVDSGLGVFAFVVPLPPGRYVVEVSEDPSAAEGEPMSDDRRFSVHLAA